MFISNGVIKVCLLSSKMLKYYNSVYSYHIESLDFSKMNLPLLHLFSQNVSLVRRLYLCSSGSRDTAGEGSLVAITVPGYLGHF